MSLRSSLHTIVSTLTDPNNVTVIREDAITKAEYNLNYMGKGYSHLYNTKEASEAIKSVLATYTCYEPVGTILDPDFQYISLPLLSAKVELKFREGAMSEGVNIKAELVYDRTPVIQAYLNRKTTEDGNGDLT